jgi:hypothetical protein
MSNELTLPKIESREDALKATRDVSTAFLVLAAISGVLAAFFMPVLLIDTVLYASLAVLLRATRSRAVASLLLLLAVLSLVTSILRSFGIVHVGGKNILLGVIAFWTAVHGVKATFLLHGRFAEASKNFRGAESA